MLGKKNKQIEDDKNTQRKENLNMMLAKFAMMGRF
jgi:hypothetical protein